jgi:hypothetical protein
MVPEVWPDLPHHTGRILYALSFKSFFLTAEDAEMKKVLFSASSAVESSLSKTKILKLNEYNSERRRTMKAMRYVLGSLHTRGRLRDGH